MKSIWLEKSGQKETEKAPSEGRGDTRRQAALCCCHLMSQKRNRTRREPRSRHEFGDREANPLAAVGARARVVLPRTGAAEEDSTSSRQSSPSPALGSPLHPEDVGALTKASPCLRFPGEGFFCECHCRYLRSAAPKGTHGRARCSRPGPH